MRVPPICFLLALVTHVAAPAAADPECIDYAQYLHLTGAALSHDRALKVAVAEPYALELGWDGRDPNGRLVPNGIYFVRLDAAGVRSSARMAIIR